ncbi:conserved hypothetical protein [Perkinsus marinus ATCC 50983]|uniref:Uncharacterized protein n=2 Tax=Perkinsus marinus (strain ATCC 50983 / TXsc) TaxID=423536 RepID=C5LN46_PERM5|nr:conserved hypothetical protein [Perkinsus marinus ATCC 50983]EER01845.1 conserved hypothetical protein [Perkinsus marinus ATCC 50983]|eukprot:XP_002769127.1 conserved hypothetical protein [Perkinsus marinus ATCC 50983]
MTKLVVVVLPLICSLLVIFQGCASTRSNFVPVTPDTSSPNHITTTASPWSATPGETTTTSPGSPSDDTSSSSPTTRTTPTTDNTPYTCDSATAAIVGTYRGPFDGSSTQGVSLQFSQFKKIGVMAGSYDSTSFSYSNIYYEFVSGQSWFSLRPFDDSDDLLRLFNLQSMDQVRVYISHQCQPIRIDFGSTTSANLAKDV